MTRTLPTPSLEDILDQFFYASETPSRELLHKLIDKYPQYSHELADFALHWSLTEPTDDSILVGKDVSEEGLLSVRSKVLNTLYENSNADAIDVIKTNI